MGKDGPVIELQDKGKAREQLLDWLPKPETDKDINNDGFIDAIKKSDNVWKEGDYEE